MRYAIRRERAGAVSLRHLRGRTAIRSATRTDWTTLETLQQTHTQRFPRIRKGIIGIGSTPAFAIGQRALLVRTDAGNILWDCIATLDDATVTLIEGLGGVDAIAISHPHFYTTMVESAGCVHGSHSSTRRRQALDHADDPAIELWDGETKTLWDGVRWCDAAAILKVARYCIGPVEQADRGRFCRQRPDHDD